LGIQGSGGNRCGRDDFEFRAFGKGIASAGSVGLVDA